MARKIRFNVAGRFYHVMLRGNDKQNIFFDDQDRCRMCFLIQEGVERFSHKIHAYCFMSNHVHLLVQLGTEPLSKIIQNLAFRYSRYINNRYERVGHLFQGRFKSILLDEEGYFLKLVRYIHFNPVDANIVQDPSEYKWSSHRSYLGLDHILWIKTEYGLKKFVDNNLPLARIKYLQYVQQQVLLEEKIFLENGNLEEQILDDSTDNAFASELSQVQQPFQKKLPILQVINSVCEAFQIDPLSLVSTSQVRHLALARGAIAKFSQEFSFASIKEIGQNLNREESTICSLLKRFKEKCRDDCDLQERITYLENKLSQLALSQTPNSAIDLSDGKCS